MKRNEFHATNREAWRQWLEENYKSTESLWLILYKKDSKEHNLSYEEAVEEALCFGWIDSTPNKRDAESYWLLFANRKPKSVWSKLNKARIKKLVKEGMMRAPGMAKINTAKKNGSWTALDAIEEYIMPEALIKALKKNKTASSNFDKFPPGVKKAIYQWIVSAKTETTLTKRVNETVEKAAQNIRANQWKPKA